MAWCTPSSLSHGYSRCLSRLGEYPQCDTEWENAQCRKWVWGFIADIEKSRIMRCLYILNDPAPFWYVIYVALRISVCLCLPLLCFSHSDFCWYAQQQPVSQQQPMSRQQQPVSRQQQPVSQQQQQSMPQQQQPVTWCNSSRCRSSSSQWHNSSWWRRSSSSSNRWRCVGVLTTTTICSYTLSDYR